MANTNIDPLKNYLFRVSRTGSNQLEGGNFVGFRSISGLSRKIDVIHYREGGDPRFARKLPGLVHFDAITMEQGVFEKDGSLWSLVKEIYDPAKAGQQTGTILEKDAVKENITIESRQAGTNGDLTTVKAWRCFETWVSDWSLGNFDANTSDVLIATIVVQMRYFDEVKL